MVRDEEIKLKDNISQQNTVDDYLQLAKHPGFARLLLSTKDNTQPNSIFSDHICRVNRHGTRKVKMIAITGMP